MAGKHYAAVSAAVTVNGTAGGYIGVADGTVFKVGMVGFLAAVGQTSRKVKIVDIVLNTLGLQVINEIPLEGTRGFDLAARYAKDSVAFATTAQGWVIYIPDMYINDGT